MAPGEDGTIMRAEEAFLQLGRMSNAGDVCLERILFFSDLWVTLIYMDVFLNSTYCISFTDRPDAKQTMDIELRKKVGCLSSNDAGGCLSREKEQE